MGWNTYYSFEGRFNEAVIHSVASRMVTDGYAAHGYRYVWLDAGWWDGRRHTDGSIQVSRSQWPHGIKALVGYLHARGLKAGLYTDAGRNGCGGQGQGSYGHIQQDMDTFAAWGVDAVKIDFCGGNEMRLTPAKIYAAYARAIGHDTDHRSMILDVCDAYAPTGSWKFGPTLAQGWRTGFDIAFGDFDPDWSGQLSVAGGHYGSILSNLDQDARHPKAAGPGHWNDPDYLQPGVPTLTPTEQRSQFSLWAMLAAPLMIGRDLRTFAPAVRNMLFNREVIAVDQDPRGAQATLVSNVGGRQVWSKPLAAPAARAVALLNRTSVPAPITVRFARIWLRGAVSIRDLWRHRNLGRHAGSYTIEVPSHATVLLKLVSATRATSSL